MKANTNSKYVVANGHVIRTYRQGLGMDVSELALKADITDKTVLKLENGGRTYVAILVAVAHALNLEVDQIIDCTSRPTKPEQPPKPSIIVDIKVSVSLEDLSDELVAWVEALAEMTSLSRHLEVVRVRRGSLFLTMFATADDAVRLTNAYALGHLAAIGVVEVTLRKEVVSFAASAQSLFSHGARLALAAMEMAGGEAAEQAMITRKYLPIFAVAASAGNERSRELLVQELVTNPQPLEAVTGFLYHYDFQLSAELALLFETLQQAIQKENRKRTEPSNPDADAVRFTLNLPPQ